MNKLITRLLIVTSCNFYLIQYSQARCPVSNIVESDAAICQINANSKNTIIDAQSIIPMTDGIYKLDGDVCINMGDQKITTKSLFYHDKDQQVSINQALIYSDKNQTINAKSAHIDIDKGLADMSDLYFKLNKTKANGKAKTLSTVDNISHLKDLIYSTCPPTDHQWYIQAESADIDQKNQIGTFRKMKLKFKGVPLIYLPYAKMPLNNQRQSGFLIPELGNSSIGGFELSIPYYINIAENFDATLSPGLISKRGATLGAEFRYLGEKYQGQITTQYLPSDKVFNRDRSFTEYKHRQRFNSHWNINSRLSNVSDNQYFEDFGNNIYATSQSFLYSFLNLNGSGDNWNFKGTLNDYQIISQVIGLNSQPYQTLPRIEYSWYNNNYNSSINYGVDTEWVNFYKENSITTTRFEITPYIERTFQNNHSRLTPKLSYRQTNWNYSNENLSSLTQLETQRSLPIASLDYTINFEKNFGDGSFSSIEPRLFYLYVPHRNQQNIPLFDTHGLTFGTGLLYQTNAFSGSDRQSDANQVSIGITQRHFDDLGVEKWNVTFGQIRYFDDRLVQLNNAIETRNSSPIITEFNYLMQNWKATLSVHWDTQIDKSERALVKIQHKGNNNSLFNFAYRFRRGKIEQLDSSVVLRIGDNTRFIARWNYSIDAHQTIEAIAGLEYKNCCWATRLVARRYVINEQGDANNGIFFELQLDGLGSIGRKPRRLLKQSILGYTEEF